MFRKIQELSGTLVSLFFLNTAGYHPIIKDGSGKSPTNGGVNGNIIYKWLIFHCHIEMVCLSEGNYRGVLLGWPGCTGLFLIFFGHQQTQVADQKWTFWDHIALAFLPLEKQNCWTVAIKPFIII
jgi:hypothetical protein